MLLELLLDLVLNCWILINMKMILRLHFSIP